MAALAECYHVAVQFTAKAVIRAVVDMQRSLHLIAELAPVVGSLESSGTYPLPVSSLEILGVGQGL